MIKLGQVLEGRYVITQNIGKGRWGHVYLAEDQRLGKTWAVKEIVMYGDSIVNLLAEPEILRKLNHPSIPRIVDIIKQNGYLYIIEDYFAGTGLKELIGNREVCTEKNVFIWGRQLAEILNYLHTMSPNPIIYRDMKPSNIIIDNDNNAKLIDFGIAREHSRERLNDTVFLGTMGYAAPELFSTSSLSDERTDLYGLGMTLYHVLTGLHPGQGVVPPRQVKPNISEGLEKLILSCVALDKESRPKSAIDFLNSLRGLEAEESSTFISRLGNFISNSLSYPSAVMSGKVHRKRGRVQIAIGGAGRRVGTTHFSLSLASFLVRQGYKTALLESTDFPAMNSLYEGQTQEPLYFLKSGIHMYPQRSSSQTDNFKSVLKHILASGFDFLILDLGQVLYQEKNRDSKQLRGDNQHALMEEFNRAEVQIILAGSAIWQLPEVIPLMQTNPFDGQEFRNLKVVLNNPDIELLSEMKRQISGELYSTVFSPNPLAPVAGLNKCYRKLLREVL